MTQARGPFLRGSRRKPKRQLFTHRIRELEQTLDRQVGVAAEDLRDVGGGDAHALGELRPAEPLLFHQQADVLAQLEQNFLKAIIKCAPGSIYFLSQSFNIHACASPVLHWTSITSGFHRRARNVVVQPSVLPWRPS